MASSRRHSRRDSNWNTNQICLAVAAGVLGSLTLWVFVAGLGGPDGIAAALGGAFCPGMFAVIPMILLIRARKRSGRSRGMAHVVRSSSRTRAGFSDVTISDRQVLPKVCVRCGGATRRTSPLSYKDAYTEASPYDWGRATPFLFFIPIFQIILNVMILTRIWQSIEKRWKRHKAAGDGVTFKIPHCKACASNHPIVQRHFDFHGRMMILEVHPAFGAGLDNM